MAGFALSVRPRPAASVSWLVGGGGMMLGTWASDVSERTLGVGDPAADSENRTEKKPVSSASVEIS